MGISNSYNSLVGNYNKQMNRLQKSMSRLATGDKHSVVGEDSANLGISEKFRSQIRRGQAAGEVIQNSMNLLQFTDSSLQEVHNILGRMNEVSISALDGSKSKEDLENLDLEFQQLKSEIGRISESGKYNDLQVNGKTAIATWNTKSKKISYTQGDGSDHRELAIDLKHGNTATNGIAFGFESESGEVGDFLFAEDGKSLLYVQDDKQTIAKLDLETQSLTTVALGNAAPAGLTTESKLIMDESGGIWVSNYEAPADPAVDPGHYNLTRLNQEDMTLDLGGGGVNNKWAGGVDIASGFAAFSIHDGHAYYVEKSDDGTHNLIKQNLLDQNDREILVADMSAHGLNAGESYSISSDGQYIAFKDEKDDGAGNMTLNNLSIIHTETKEAANVSVGSDLTSVVNLGFDANNNLYWTDTGGETDANAVKKLKLSPGGELNVDEIETIRNGTAGEFERLSVGGGSAATNFQFQVGAQSGMDVEFSAADVRLTKLGISDLSVRTFEKAGVAAEKLTEAVENVSKQRAKIGAQVSRLEFAHTINESSIENSSSAESRLRDTDFARESAEMTKSQITSQASSSMLAQAKQLQQGVLQLIQ